MKCCLDTCAYSRLLSGNGRLQLFLEEVELLVIPVVVLGELHTGFEGGTRKAENEARLGMFLETSGVRKQDVTWDIARRYGILVNHLRQNGMPMPTNDIWIAATALDIGARLVTYDAHYQHIPGLLVESP